MGVGCGFLCVRVVGVCGLFWEYWCGLCGWDLGYFVLDLVVWFFLGFVLEDF